VALRGASKIEWDSKDQNNAGSLVLGASAMVLLVKAASNMRRRQPHSMVRTVRQAEDGDGPIPLSDLEAGEKEFAGKVVRDASIGVYIDIGAEKEALLPRNMVPKGKKYEPGEEISGLKIYEVQSGSSPADRKIRVTLGNLPSSYNVGDKVKGTVRATQTYGVFFDIGMARDALAPSSRLSKKPSDYAEDEEVELEVVSIEGDKVTVAVAGMAAPSAAPSTKLSVGQTVTGTVARVNQQYGVFFNIGSGRDALCFTNQLDKDLDMYKEADKVEGLRISKIDGDKVEVTTRPLASEAKVGQKVQGMVMTQIRAGIFFDAGFSSDVLAPPQLLRKPVDEYSPQEVADLIITQVDGDRVTVSDKNPEDIPKPLTDFLRGQSVSGKVVRVEPNGLLLDIGAAKAATWRTKGWGATLPPKDIKEYQPGEEVTGLIVMKVDPVAQILEVSLEGAEIVESGISMASLKVGQEVSGTVTKAMAFGVFVDIGAERDALYAVGQLEKKLEEYQEGMELSGLRVTEVDPERQRLGISMRPGAADFNVGDEVTGKVTKKMPFGLFVDIGACVDALLPSALLEKPLEEYEEGEALEKLQISRLNPSSNQISVSEKEGAESSAARISFSDLEEGKPIPGVVRGVRDYGAFVDIGLGRTDALMPNSMMGDKTGAAFKPNQELEVYVVRIDEQAQRVTVSAVKPTAEMRGQRARGRSGTAKTSPDSYIPEGFMIPDPKRHVEVLGGREELMDGEPIPWYEWAEKYPGFVKFQEEDHVIVISANAYGFVGMQEMNHANQAVIKIPKHLQKPDAVQPEGEVRVKIEEADMPNYDIGISPEIHTKYRQPPMNDPNWRFSTIPDVKTKNISWKAVVDAAEPFVPTAKPEKKEVEEGGED